MSGISEFCESMASNGLRCPDSIVPDGKIHRFHVDSDKTGSKNGWYVFYGNDGLPAGSYGSWKTGETFKWCGKEEKTLTEAERAELRERIARAKKLRDEEQKRLHLEAQKRAQAEWEKAKPVKEHPYLKAKGVKSYSLREDSKGRLVVPLKDTIRVIHTLQTINTNGDKLFLPGGAVQRHYFTIGEPDGVILICEGYATGASLHKATGYPVIIAFNAGNLKPVCEALRKKLPESKFIICSDDDYQTDGNPGLTKAKEAAEAVGAGLAVPKFKDQAHRGTDFNDLHQAEGLGAVRYQIEDALMRIPAGQAETKEPVIPSLLSVPVDVFPDDIQNIINSLGEAHGTTSEVAVTAILAVAGSLIGWSRRLIAKEGWHVHASLYAVTAAETGEGKSPTTDFLLKPVEKLEQQEFSKHKDAMEEYEMKLQEWQAEKKNLRGQKPKPPRRKRFKMGDCTIEAMADALDDNPKGLLWFRDELNGLFLDLDKYTGKDSSTKTKLLEAYDLKAWQIDRANKDRTTYIPKACLGLFGTIQPKILSQAFGDLDAASGFLPRFIIIYSAKNEPTLWSEEGISDSMGATWSRYVQALASYELELADFPKSRLVGLSEDAKNQYIAWYNQIAIQPWNNIEDGFFKAIVPKMQEQALRLCLILHCLESIAFGKDETSPVRMDTMQRALRLADWVWSHQKRTWSLLNKNTAAGHAPLAQRIAAAIIELEPEPESNVLSTSKITEQLNKGIDEKHHISPDSLGRACSQKLQLQKGPNKNQRGWIITPDIISHLKSVYGLTTPTSALSARSAQNTHQPGDTGAGTSFSSARSTQNTHQPPKMGTFLKCPTSASTLNSHQPPKMGTSGTSGTYLPEISNHLKTGITTSQPACIKECDVVTDQKGNLGGEIKAPYSITKPEQEVVEIW